MTKLAMLLMMLPLVAFSDLVDPLDNIPGFGKPFSPAFLGAVCLVVGGMILVCHSVRSFVVRFLLMLVLLVCVVMFYAASDEKCTACDGYGRVRGGTAFVSGRCPCCNGSGQHLRWRLKKCLTHSELVDRLGYKDREAEKIDAQRGL